MSDMAYTARVTMSRADWGDENGSTVTLKLPMVDDAEDKRNPFHSFTKRRKGKAGTRFMMACHTAGEGVRHALYEDEAMLAGWNDSQQNGHTVKLWLCNDGMGHPFEGVDRKTTLVISLVELDDDQEAIDPKMRERVEKQHDTSRQKLSNVAAMFCRTPEFSEWVNGLEDELSPELCNEEDAKQWMYVELGISSRAELDSDTVAANRFNQSVLEPYRSWYNANYEPPF